LTDEFTRRYSELPLSIQKKAELREEIFRQNPFHPSLHTEKLNPRKKEIWSFRIDYSYRILFRFAENNAIYFLSVGPHSWIYRYMNRI